MDAPNPSKTRQRNQDVVRQSFDRLAAQDVAGFLDLWAEDCVQEMPFATAGPTRLKGKAALAEQYAIVPASYRWIRYPELGFRELGDPEWTMAEYRCEAEISSNGNRYENNYLGLFRHAPDGRIEVFREYFNPTPLEQAMRG